MTSKDTNWKKHLLRSSVPLEYEAARTLSVAGFHTSFDHSYSRLDAGADTECSVDVRGVKTITLSDGPAGFSSLDVLVECKYRERGTSWLFLADPKGASTRLSNVLNGIDYFSAKFIHGPDVTVRRELDKCIAGVEIREGANDGSGTNRMAESALRHGLRQLQYALPALIALRIRMSAVRDLPDNMPFFVMPILLTNAQLVVADTEFGVSTVESAKNPEDLGKQVSSLVWSAELGPDFDLHCQRKFAELGALAGTKRIQAVETHRRAAGESFRVLPSELARRIEFDGGDAIEFATYSDVLVVNVSRFASTIEAVNDLFRDSCSSLKDVPLVRWTEDGRPIFPWS